jgi:hypothetical protein
MKPASCRIFNVGKKIIRNSVAFLAVQKLGEVYGRIMRSDPDPVEVKPRKGVIVRGLFFGVFH